MVTTLTNREYSNNPETDARFALKDFASDLPKRGGDPDAWYEHAFELAEKKGFTVPPNPFNIHHAFPAGAIEISHNACQRRFVMVPLTADHTRENEEKLFSQLTEDDVVSTEVRMVPDDLGEFLAYEVPYISVNFEHALRNTTHTAALEEQLRTAGKHVKPHLYVIGSSQREISLLPPFIPKPRVSAE